MSKPARKSRSLETQDDSFSHASSHLQPEPGSGRKIYLERTQRNHFWVGGEIGQKRVQRLRIAIAGLGGIGGSIAEALVRLGVGHLRIADLDQIDHSNINRQVIATRRTVGRNKADAMTDHLRSIADDYELVVYREGVHEAMAEEFVEGCDAIIDEIDVFALDRKLPLHRAARKRGIPVYTAYCVGLGIHFYKFQGDRYTIEDFLDVKSPEWKKPSGEFLLRKIGEPFPGYLDEEAVGRFESAVDTGRAPIFGPATLLGHSLVTTRVLFDLLGRNPNCSGLVPTPVMPEFLALDAGELSFKKARMPQPGSRRKTRKPRT